MLEIHRFFLFWRCRDHNLMCFQRQSILFLIQNVYHRRLLICFGSLSHKMRMKFRVSLIYVYLWKFAISFMCVRERSRLSRELSSTVDSHRFGRTFERWWEFRRRLGSDFCVSLESPHHRLCLAFKIRRQLFMNLFIFPPHCLCCLCFCRFHIILID